MFNVNQNSRFNPQICSSQIIKNINQIKKPPSTAQPLQGSKVRAVNQIDQLNKEIEKLNNKHYNNLLKKDSTNKRASKLKKEDVKISNNKLIEKEIKVKGQQNCIKILNQIDKLKQGQKKSLKTSVSGVEQGLDSSPGKYIDRQQRRQNIRQQQREHTVNKQESYNMIEPYPKLIIPKTAQSLPRKLQVNNFNNTNKSLVNDSNEKHIINLSKHQNMSFSLHQPKASVLAVAE